MDSLTQIALGAVTGYAVAGHKLGRRAIAFGALAGTTPDLDTFVLLPFDDWASWRYHRGVSHSLFFGPVVGPVLGWLAWRYYRWRKPEHPVSAEGTLPFWIATFIIALFTHPLLDFFTVYGTQLLSPLTNARFSLSGVGIIDPIYTVPMIAAAIVALVRPARAASTVFAWLVLWLTTAFLFYGVAQNQRVETMARTQLQTEGVVVSDVRVYTTIFQPWLRRVVVDEPEGGRVAYASSLQTGAIAWKCFVAPRDPRIDALRATEEGQLLAWFADGDLWPRIVANGDGSALVQLWDRRYGITGETNNGWWGIEAAFRTDGTMSPPQRASIPRDFDGNAIGQLFRASLGEPTALFPQRANATDAAADCRQQRL